MSTKMQGLCKDLLLLVGITVAAVLLQSCTCQQEFTTARIPDPFRVGDFYPPRPEVEVCRPIRDYIARGSARFNNELVTNSNPLINFNSQNSRIMTSRMQTRLNTLASRFYNQFGRKIRVLKAWTPFPDPELSGDEMSLHYEGRTVRVRVDRSGDYDDLCEFAVIDAAFDWVYFESSNLVRLSVIPNDCDRNVDCVFMLDQSGSVGRNNHNIAIEFIRNVVKFFNIGLDASRFGFIAYSTNAHLEFDLDDHTSLSSLDNAISHVNYRGGWTATALALNGSALLLNPDMAFGARPNSEGIPKIAILITDGKSNQFPIAYAAPALKNQGVQVYTVGIGNIDANELRFISSDPDNEHVFILNSFADAPAFVQLLSVVACETPAIVDTCERTTSTISDGTIQYFQVECSSFASNVQVELQDVRGTNFLFCSATESNPGPLTANTERDTRTAVTTRSCTLNVASNDNVVFVGIQGQASNNEFSLTVWNVLFNQETVTIEVLEGTTGNVHDITSNLLSPSVQYLYNIISGNEQNLFTVNPAGSLRVRSSTVLEYDQQSLYRLDIQASNSNEVCQCGRIRVDLIIVSREINFNNLPDQQIPEDANTGRRVSTVEVTNGGSSSVQYSISGGNTGSAFRIGMNSGIIRVNNQLDFETLARYTLTITAETTRLGMDISDTVTQTITIQDVNEPPYFVTACANTPNGCSFSLDENEDAGHVLGTIMARDPDNSNSPNGMISYRFQQTNPPPFFINPNGQITTTEPLDREERASYVLTLVAMDSSISIQTTVRITVNDLNDNPPVFVQAPTNVQVRENAPQGFDVAQYIAEDRDAGVNGEITYSLSSSVAVPFGLDSQTGLLTVDGSIDYETVQMYTVEIEARNPGSNTQRVSVMVQIEVLNLNDNTPQFSQSSYSASVMEHSSTGLLITPVQATDNDLNDHGTVRYLIIDGNINNLLSIGAMNGQIRVAGDIDREEITALTLTVEARDNGSPQTRQSRVPVTITVSDINDNAPIFRPDTHSLVLREDIQPTFDVVRLFASDRDEPGNPNSMIVYSIQSGNDDGKFQLNSASGQLQLIQSLDFDSGDTSYNLQILASDQGLPSLTDTATVMIQVTNVNEDPPMLSGDQAVEISELASVGASVAVFNALDPDNMPVTFSINSGNEEAKFVIGGSSGIITLAASLDFETTMEYTLGIQASDGSQQASVSLTVSVLDENEFTPEFNGATSFEINEEESAGSLVGTLMATDGDAGPNNSRITFSFVQQTQFTSLFNLNPSSGEIRTSIVLDRETLLQIFPPPDSEHSIDVSARDDGNPSLQSITTITVRLVDINDNAPVFSDQRYLNSLLENLPTGQRVFQLGATDIDLGSNSQIMFSFSLASNIGDTVPFEIDSDTGFIQTTQPLDCELQASYNFTLTATDMGNPSMSSEVQGTLTIIDENDNDPMFTMDVYRVTINETEEVGSTILQVMANDPDKGSNGEVVYSVINAESTMDSIESQDEEMTFFMIDSTTGSLSHLTPFNFEVADEVNVTVLAHDMGVPRRSGSAQVIFTVLNVDETPPRFVGSCDASVSEDVQVMGVVTQCTAVDLDNITTSNDQIAVTYGIFGGGGDREKFMIDEITGIITIAELLDAEEETSYSITISATDLAGRKAFQQVTITVLDVNDNAPQFTSPSYEFKLSDSDINNYRQEIIIVRATDADISGDNGVFTFSIGTITPRIEQLQTTVEIVATDHGIPSLNSTSILTVTFDSQCLLQDYEVVHSESARGTVSVYVLCRVELRPDRLEVPLRSSSGTFYCNILRNSPMTFQWLQNGSAITASEELAQGRSETSYTIQRAQFEDAGEYACKASTRVGSLQTANGVVNIQVPPVITIPPEDVAVKEGGIATLTCSASGTPKPTIEWLLGEQVVATGSPLVIDDIDKANRGFYTCRAISPAGEATAAGRLTLYGNTDVVEIGLGDVNNPNEDGTCHILNVDQFEAVLNDITSRRTMITAIQGADICEQTACIPNPCANGGKCELTDSIVGGYVCTCAEGFTGRNCTEDVDECINDPCGPNGNCTNEKGRYKCKCSDGISGHRCQFSDVCTPDICTNEEICVETFSSGYICREIPDLSSSLVVRGFMGDPGFLSDSLQTFIEQQLALNPKNRRRRQTSGSTFATFCEPRFYQSDDSVLVLLWICPAGETEPSPEELMLVCTFLLQQGLVRTCKPPNGEEMEQPTAPPLPDIEVKIEIILIDSDTNVPLDGLESTQVLVDNGAQNELTDSTGLTVNTIIAQVTGPRTETPSSVDQGNSAGAIAGGVIVGLLVVVALVAGGIFVVIVGSKKFTEHKERQKEKQKYALQMASMASNISLAERGAELAIERENSMNQLIDDDGGNDYDTLPLEASVTQESTTTVLENVKKEE